MAEPIPPHIQLKQMREKQGLTQLQAAEYLNTDVGELGRWERGLHIPQFRFRKQIAEKFNIPIEAWMKSAREVKAAQEEQIIRPLHVDEQRYPDVWTVPFEPSFFIGRQDSLQRLREALLAGKTTALTQVISGLGGIGKTMTAARYAFLYRGEYKAVFWINADTREKLRDGLLRMADDLNLPEKQLENPDQVLASVKRWMREQAEWLLILDNIEDMAYVHELLPEARRGHVLLTTRKQPTTYPLTNIELTGLSPEDGALLLLQRAGRLPETELLDQADEQERAIAKQLSFQMEGLPLALEQAGAYIWEQECSLAEYLEWYKTRRAYLHSWRSSQYLDDANVYPFSVATTWSLSFDKIRQESSEAVALLSFFAFLDPDVIPEELVLLSISELGSSLEAISDVPTLLEVLAPLRRYSFVHRNRDKGGVNIHRVVQAVFKDNMDEETQKRWAEQTVRALHKVFKEVREKPLQEQDRYFPHMRQCYEWIQQMSLCFSEAAQLLLLGGDYAQERLAYNEAEKYLLQAMTIIETIRASGHIERAVVYNNIAMLYQKMEKHRFAETYLRKAIPLVEKSSLPQAEIKILLARTTNNLAGVQEQLNNLVEAEFLARKAVELIRQVKNVDIWDIIGILNTYEIVLYRLHKYKAAQQVSAQIDALYLHERATDKERARMLERRGEIQSPMQVDLIEQALALFQKIYGPMHPDIAHCLSALGAGYLERGDYMQAKLYSQQALDMYMHMKQEEHSDVIVILMQLVGCSLFLNELKEARVFLQQAQKFAEKNPSPYVSEQVMKMYDQMLKMYPSDD